MDEAATLIQVAGKLWRGVRARGAQEFSMWSERDRVALATKSTELAEARDD